MLSWGSPSRVAQLVNRRQHQSRLNSRASTHGLHFGLPQVPLVVTLCATGMHCRLQVNNGPDVAIGGKAARSTSRGSTRREPYQRASTRKSGHPQRRSNVRAEQVHHNKNRQRGERQERQPEPEEFMFDPSPHILRLRISQHELLPPISCLNGIT